MTTSEGHALQVIKSLNSWLKLSPCLNQYRSRVFHVVNCHVGKPIHLAASKAKKLYNTNDRLDLTLFQLFRVSFLYRRTLKANCTK
jgi:hypothetical protein